MTKQTFAAFHYFLAIVTLAIMLNSSGWLLMFSAVLWVPAFVLHIKAIYRGSKAYPKVAGILWVSTVGFLTFALIRYDGGDTGGYTGLSCILAMTNLRSSALIKGGEWEYLQLAYFYLFAQLLLDLKIIRTAGKKLGAS